MLESGHGPWQSAYWLAEIGDYERLICDLKTRRPLNWEADVAQYRETLTMMYGVLLQVQAEEAERPTWTREQWARAEERAARKLQFALDTPNESAELQKELLESTRAEIEFYQHPEKFDALTEGVRL